MAKLSFQSALMITGLAFCAPLVGCGEGGVSKPTCEGSDCEEQDSPVNESDAKVKDAGGRKDATVRQDGSSGTTDKASELPCDVKPLVTKYCGDCHGATPKFSAPMSLVNASDFAKAKPASVEKRVAETDPRNAMPPTTSKQPSAEEKATIVAWLEEGAPGSSEKCSTTQEPTKDAGVVVSDSSTPPPVDEELECFKFLAHSGNGTGKFNVGAARDSYFNMTFKAQWKGTAYGILIKPIIDNDQVIHHWLLFQDDLPGTPNAIASSVGAHPAGQLLHGWAPGGEPLDLRNGGVDVGLELPGDNQTYTLEYHYNSSDIAAKDASGVEVCITKRKTANVAALSWLGNDQLLIPSAKWSGTCRPTSKEPIHIVAVVPHMHQQGTHMKGTITRKDGSKEILHDEPFDFDYQRLYEKNVTLMPGESILTECTFAQPMSFGTATDAEMCYLFTVAYPKGALASPDAWGAFAHGGSSCLGQ